VGKKRSIFAVFMRLNLFFSNFGQKTCVNVYKKEQKLFVIFILDDRDWNNDQSSRLKKHQALFGDFCIRLHAFFGRNY
jgi:hypothetical protein